MTNALIVRGGARFHFPAETTGSFVPFLERSGFSVTLCDSLEVYEDEDLLAGTGLIVQCWTDGELTDARSRSLERAVRAGTGLAGWHGGIVAAFADRRYQWLTGGWFVGHPGDFVAHELVVRPQRAGHPIVAGIDRVALHTERYWMLTDGLNDVLATVTFPAGTGSPWPQPVTVPAVYTRRWGAGRVFVSTVGHHPPDLDVPQIRTLTERGLLWAAGRLPER